MTTDTEALRARLAFKDGQIGGLHDTLIWKEVELAEAATALRQKDEEIARLREALEDIALQCDRSPLLVGFLHSAPNRQELQERLDGIKASARTALNGGNNER